jgi:hypothetical protein
MPLFHFQWEKSPKDLGTWEKAAHVGLSSHFEGGRGKYFRPPASLASLLEDLTEN